MSTQVQPQPWHSGCSASPPRMEKTSGHRFDLPFAAVPANETERSTVIIPDAPKSGVRLKPASGPLQGLRQLARSAESLGLDPVAFELFFAVARLESGRRVEAVRSDLVETAETVPEMEARFYRAAAKSLASSLSLR